MTICFDFVMFAWVYLENCQISYDSESENQHTQTDTHAKKANREVNDPQWFFCQMTSRSLKTQTCCVKEWRRCGSTRARRSERKAVAGECSASENRTTRWTWRPLSPTRESSAMEVSDCSLSLSKTYRINTSKDVCCLHHSGSGFHLLIIKMDWSSDTHQSDQ